MSKHTVSRQRAWQLRKLNAMLCSSCGKEPLWQSHETCRACTFKRAEKAKSRYHEKKGDGDVHPSA